MWTNARKGFARVVQLLLRCLGRLVADAACIGCSKSLDVGERHRYSALKSPPNNG